MAVKVPSFAAKAAERSARAFVVAYAAVWQASGLDYDHLFTLVNVKGGVVGAALAFFISFGAKFRGDPNNPSLIQ